MTLEEADKAAGDGGDWIVNGLTEYDAKGAASRAYRAWFWDGPNPEDYPLGDRPTTKYGRQRYDAFGRQVETYGLDGTVTLRSVYHALSSDAWDAADLAPGPHYGTYASAAKDGHGRSVSTTERAHGAGGIEERVTRTDYLPSGEVVKITRQLGAQQVVRWLRYDSLGRRVLNVEPNTTADHTETENPSSPPEHAWRYAYDDAGNLVGTSDARGCGVNYVYDYGGRLLGEDYSPCEAQHPAYSAPNWSTGDGFEVRYKYDFLDADVPAETDCPINPDLLSGRLVSVSDRGAKTVTGYDGRGRTTCLARKLMNPAGTGYVDDWYTQRAAYDNADRTIVADTGAKSAELKDGDGLSVLKTEFTKRGTVKTVFGSYGMLAYDVRHDADGLPLSITYGDLAQTQTAYQYDDRLRLKNVITYRGPPTQWTTAAYTPTPTYGTGQPTTFQLVLQNYDYSYDAVDNPTEIRDWRIASEWPAGSKPLTRKMEYDDLYRVSKVDYQYEAGDDTWVDPFDAETKSQQAGGTPVDSRLAKPSPHVSYDKRIKQQTFKYDWLGNTTSTDDDVHGFYDRSLGTITNDTAGNKPYQLKAASNEASGRTRQGHLTAKHDAAGNLTSMAVHRDGTCLPTSANCKQRYVYEWDEAGRLTRARRWDLASAGDASDLTPAATAAADLRYTYDSGDQRVRKTAVDGAGTELHTLYPLGSLEVRRTQFVNGVYERTAQTEVPYLLAHGVRLGRVAWEPSDVPSLADTTGILAGRLHVFLELADHLGSTSIVIDKGTSELVEAGTYQAYGGAESDYRPERWKSFREDHRFTGKEEDVEVGLQYFGFRYLSPLLGRWVSADPLAVHGLGADPNSYAYVSGKALSAVDPVGLLGADLPPEASPGQLNEGVTPEPEVERSDTAGGIGKSIWNFGVGSARGIDWIGEGLQGRFGHAYNEDGERVTTGEVEWSLSWNPYMAKPSSPGQAKVMRATGYALDLGSIALPAFTKFDGTLFAESKSAPVVVPTVTGGKSVPSAPSIPSAPSGATLEVSRTPRAADATTTSRIGPIQGDSRFAPPPDSALVCRGGVCTAQSFSDGSGVTTGSDGRLSGISTQSRVGGSVELLSQPFRNGQVGVTTVGKIRGAGGTVVMDGTARNPNHATVSGITPADAEKLFTPTVPNPNPKDVRGTIPNMPPNN